MTADDDRDMTLDSYVDPCICSRCEGTGYIARGGVLHDGPIQGWKCPECGGTGKAE